MSSGSGPKKITREDALALVGGKTEKPRGVDPCTWITEDAEYYLGMVPIAMLGDPEHELSLLEWVGVDDPQRAAEYAKRTTQAPPVVVAASKRSKAGFVSLLDGGHRVKAAVDQGKAGILAVVRVRDGVPLDSGITAFLAPKLKPELVGYEWRSREGERFCAWDGGLVPAKVSDWDRTETSAGSGREIVHVYWVRDENGEIKPYGKQTAMKALGIPYALFEKKANRLLVEAERKRAAAENASRAFDTMTKASSIAEANRAWRLANCRSRDDFEKLDQRFGNTAVFEKDGLFLTRTKGTDMARLAESKGYRIVLDNRTLGHYDQSNEEDNGPSPK